jgi:hypothetical protein
MKPSEWIDDKRKAYEADGQFVGRDSIIAAILAYLDERHAASEASSPTLHAWAIIDPRIPRLEGLYRWRPNDEIVAKWEAEGLMVKRIEVPID